MTKENLHKFHLEFTDNALLSALVGPHDRHLTRIEQRLGVSLALRGNHISISGPEPEASYAKAAIQYLHSQLMNL